jgi:outer membrane autotransporter protein
MAGALSSNLGCISTMKTSHGAPEGKWRLRTMAGASVLFMPLASQASDLLWTGRDRDQFTAVNVQRHVIGSTQPSAWRAHAFRKSTSQSNEAGDIVKKPVSAAPREAVTISDNSGTQVQARPASRPSPGTVADKVTPKHKANDEAQIAAHIATPAALFAYGTQINDGLHQRLGEIRNVLPTNDIGGEVFVRYNGSQFNIASGAGLSKDGRNFKQQSNAVQLGGSAIGWNEEGSNLRAGWAYDQGSVRINPKKSGAGYTDYKAKGMSLWLTAQRDNGLYVDVVAGSRRYNGRIHDISGASAAEVKAKGWAASVETGLPMPLTESVTIEPQAKITYQSLRIDPIESASGTITRSERGRRTTARVGVRIAKTDNERFIPYAKVDFSTQFGGASKISSFDRHGENDATFDGVQPGNSVEFSAGMTIKITRVVDFYGDVGMQRRLGDRGADGLAASAGVRINF